MSTAASGLRQLHQLQQRLRDVEERLRRGPKQIETRRQAVEKRREDLTVRREQLKRLRMAADQKSLQLRTNEAKIADLRTKLNQASSNREYDILRSQIDADSMANSVLEDEILEALEKVDEMQRSIEQSEREIATAEKEVDRVRQEVSTAEPDLTREAAQLKTAIAEAERVLPATIMDSYRRLVQAHGADALAAVDNKACTSCHAVLSPQEQVNVNTGKIMFCRSCGRILYRAEGP
ncbi:MAG TPA: C4-type zinc ribbon domain-containing protein [Planctomycetaceae bacterium]|nr:C4-type zinc ribbon domain-containing protein [Planctomycetaceae bacterium]